MTSHQLASYAASWAPIGLSILLHTTALLLIGFLIAALLRHQRASVLSFFYRTLLVGVILTSCLSLGLKGQVNSLWSFSFSALDEAPTSGTIESTTSSGNEPSPNSSAVMALPNRNISTISAAPSNTRTPIEAVPPIQSHASWLSVVAIAVWFIGAAIQLVWLWLAHLSLSRLCRESHIIRDQSVVSRLNTLSAVMGIQAPQLLTHEKVQTPFLTGLFRPAVILPANSINEFDDTAQQAILLHELAHLSRRDCEWKYLSRLLCAILWPQPLLWLLCRRLEQVNELCCDEQVVRGGCSPSQYAGVLLHFAERLTLRPGGQCLEVHMVTFRSSLANRIQRIIEHPIGSTLALSWTTRLSVVAGVLAALASVPLLVAVEAEPQEVPRTPHNHRVAQVPKEIPDEPLGPEFPQSLKEARGDATIIGRVLYENGKPAAGVKVGAGSRLESRRKLWGYERNPSNHWRWPPEIRKLLGGTAVTGADGTYRITGIISQKYGVSASQNRNGNEVPVGWIAPYRGVRVKALAKRTVTAPDIVLVRGGIIKIKVVDQATGAPLEGITLRGFTIDKLRTPQPATCVDAHGQGRPMQGFPSTTQTDRNGAGTISLRAGTTYFYLTGSQLMRSILQDDRKANPPYRSSPETTVTPRGIYKLAEQCEVVIGKGIPRQAWKGETMVPLKKAQVLSVTFRLKKYADLSPEDKAIWKYHFPKTTL